MGVHKFRQNSYQNRQAEYRGQLVKLPTIRISANLFKKPALAFA